MRQGYERSLNTAPKADAPVTVLGRWTQGNWFLLALPDKSDFFWILDSVNFQGDAPAIALPWWKPIPAPDPWREATIDSLSVYTAAVADWQDASPAARWEFQIAQGGDYSVEAWVPSEASARLSYGIGYAESSTFNQTLLQGEIDQSELDNKPVFYPLGTLPLPPDMKLEVRVSEVKSGARATATGATAVIGPVRLVRK